LDLILVGWEKFGNVERYTANAAWNLTGIKETNMENSFLILNNTVWI